MREMYIGLFNLRYEFLLTPSHPLTRAGLTRSVHPVDLGRKGATETEGLPHRATEHTNGRHGLRVSYSSPEAQAFCQRVGGFILNHLFQFQATAKGRTFSTEHGK
jgi:hypothetical protein